MLNLNLDTPTHARRVVHMQRFIVIDMHQNQREGIPTIVRLRVRSCHTFLQWVLTKSRRTQRRLHSLIPCIACHCDRRSWRTLARWHSSSREVYLSCDAYRGCGMRHTDITGVIVRDVGVSLFRTEYGSCAVLYSRINGETNLFACCRSPLIIPACSTCSSRRSRTTRPSKPSPTSRRTEERSTWSSTSSNPTPRKRSCR